MVSRSVEVPGLENPTQRKPGPPGAESSQGQRTKVRVPKGPWLRYPKAGKVSEASFIGEEVKKRSESFWGLEAGSRERH